MRKSLNPGKRAARNRTIAIEFWRFDKLPSEASSPWGKVPPAGTRGLGAPVLDSIEATLLSAQTSWKGLLLLGTLALWAGCRPEKDKDQDTNGPVSLPPAQTLSDAAHALGSGHPTDLAAARRSFQAGDLEATSQRVAELLIENPNDDGAKLLACEIEAAQGHHRRAAELAGSISLTSRFGKSAVELRYQQLLQAGLPQQAIESLLFALETYPQCVPWRHEAWRLLSRLGRRQEASLQADRLCQIGAANRDELLSLLRRNDSYPFALADNDSPSHHFEPGLGMAKWYFTQRDYRRALQELREHDTSEWDLPDSLAFYGRLLAETQAFEEVPQWMTRCASNVDRFNDYWAALGTYFYDQHQYEASARALMEALLRDPTDDLSAHRLAKVFHALGRHEDAEQARNRAVWIVQLEQHGEQLVQSPNDPEAHQGMTQKLLELGRPFESLAWTQQLLPPGAVQTRAAVGRQLMNLNRNARALNMAFEMSQMEIDRSELRIEKALAAIQHPRSLQPANDAKSVQIMASPRLVNVASQVGLHFQWYPDEETNLASIPLHEVMGGGIAVIDFDLNGWPDVYLAQGSGEPPSNRCTRSNQLFRNLAGEFAEVTENSHTSDFHYSSGLASGDVNQDGFPDLLLASLGRNRLLINNGDGTFHDATAAMGEAPDRFTSSVAIADLNGDNLPDLFETSYVEMEGGFRLPEVGPDGREIPPSPRSFYAQSDRWLLNLGDGNFEPRIISEDIATAGSGLGLIITDFDLDGSNEVFVANDGRPNHLLEPSSKTPFQNSADAKGLAVGFTGEANACMGIAAGDFDRNGMVDLHVTNFSNQSANHYLQAESTTFTDAATRFGIDQWSIPYIGFGVKSIDIDRNGWLDLLVTNGHIFDQSHLGEAFRMPAQLLMNQGNRFEQVEVQDDSGYWRGKYLGRSLAKCDFNRDGSLDFLVGHLDQPLALLQNQTETQGHWIQLELVGTSSERDAIGAHLVVICGDEQWHGWVVAGDGYLCTDEPVIDLGLGEQSAIDQLEVTWPSGKKQTFRSIAGDARYLITEDEPTLFRRTARIQHLRVDGAAN